MTKKIIILGATGSIGRQTIECVEEANRRQPGSFEVTGLSANSDIQGLIHLSKGYPKALLAAGSTVFSSSHPAPRLNSLQGQPKPEAKADPYHEPSGSLKFTGSDAVERLLEHCCADLVVNGIAGSPGLKASYLALQKGMNLALANKESVVMGYGLLSSIAEKKKLSIIPVDSEHAALFQLIQRCGTRSVRELCITASGGPFRDKSLAELKAISPAQAAAHPVWKMGKKISIDSATLANKGLELIEAVRLFDFSEQAVRVLIHPQSLIHALVRTVDGSLYANLSSPDMRLPIDIALHWPGEVESAFGKLDLAGMTLSFFEPDLQRFPMLRLARESLGGGEAASIAYNASNETAVDAFVEGRICFTDIARVVEGTLNADWALPAGDLDSIFYHDARAKEKARNIIAEIQC
ncbi:MAG: 1-deoxy-D-xylulose-5-phosphate reductoisomerase [Spirochaetia bacterium]|jgi:1-deoxy-D-xylulose-5-phosphate reductoisomerase|nr:1-deoxy-D-xylulose-5-phosphate reductoisomerase [Spirochaetales bacterium]MDX9783558.1 1-deoxy-D-xylulose-5-phosphate reductoisomerase [Spirochaetia bacterium]